MYGFNVGFMYKMNDKVFIIHNLRKKMLVTTIRKTYAKLGVSIRFAYGCFVALHNYINS